MNITETESVRKRSVIIKELVQGQKAATQLKFLLENQLGSVNVSLSSEEEQEQLATNVLRSFTQALSIISQPDYQNQLNSGGGNGSPVVASGDDPPSGDSTNETRKRSLPARNGGRGCYKRRKSAQTWTIVSRTTDDNHAWRKYGQKEIMSSEFPRSYYRCTHKNDQGCSATKQVQRTQENPDMFQITYIGIHTCNTPYKATTHLISNSSTTPNLEAFLVNSSDSPDPNVPSEQDHHISSPTPSLTIKQEYDPKEHTPINVTYHQPPSILPLKIESHDNADAVYSSTGKDHYGMESVHLGIDFDFDECQLLQCFDNYM